MGVLAMGGGCPVFNVPWLDRSHVQGICRCRPIWKWCVWLFVIDFFVLMYCGAMRSRRTICYNKSFRYNYWFGFLFILAPLIGHFEKPKELPSSIHQSMEVKT